MNFARRNSCNQCGEPRPEDSRPSGGVQRQLHLLNVSSVQIICIFLKKLLYSHVFPQISVAEVATEESGAIEGAAAEAGTGEVAMGARWEEGKRSLCPCLAVGLIGTVETGLFMCASTTATKIRAADRSLQRESLHPAVEFYECFWIGSL